MSDGSSDATSSKLRTIVLERAYTRATEPFQLSSGGFSYDYVDMRRGLARGEDLGIAAEAVISRLERQGLAYDAIGGMTMGADPVAHAVALLSGCEWFSVRKAEKSHGSRQRIEGARLGPTSQVIVFEDIVSTGRSLLEALDVIVEAGASVCAALTLLDRGEVAAELFAQRGVPYYALLDYRAIGIEPIASSKPSEAGTAAPG